MSELSDQPDPAATADAVPADPGAVDPGDPSGAAAASKATLEPASRPPWLGLVGIGLGAGFLSGMFGVGGGIVIVPALIMLAGMARKRASGTSLVAIVPTAVVGVVGYATQGGHVDVLVAAVLAAGAVVGAQVGSWLLQRLPVAAIRWAFIVFLLVVATQLFATTPVRTATFVPTPGSVTALVALGVAAGVLSGLLGVGGGLVVVPLLIVVFGVSDLVAKGSSLLMMIPTAVSGTVGNLRRGNADVRAGAVVGVSACVTSAAGTWAATLLPPRAANIVLALFIVAVVGQMVHAARSRPDA